MWRGTEGPEMMTGGKEIGCPLDASERIYVNTP